MATLLALLARALGWFVVDDVTAARPDTAFIYTPDKRSFIAALIAAAAGVLSLTSAEVGGLSGVFISSHDRAGWRERRSGVGLHAVVGGGRERAAPGAQT